MTKRLCFFLAAAILFLDGARAQQPGQAAIVINSPDGRLTISALGKVIDITDAQAQKKILSLRGHTATITALAVSPDGKHLASGSQDKTIALWDMRRGLQFLRIQADGAVSSLTFSANGKSLTSRTSGKTLTEWDIATGKIIRKVDEKK